MHTSLVIVVAAIVILITALVLVTIFGVGIGQVASITQAKNNCITQALASCRATNALPITWDYPMSVTEGGQQTQQSCRELTVYNRCNQVPGYVSPP